MSNFFTVFFNSCFVIYLLSNKFLFTWHLEFTDFESLYFNTLKQDRKEGTIYEDKIDKKIVYEVTGTKSNAIQS